MENKEKLKVKYVYDGEAALSDIFADMIASKIKAKSFCFCSEYPSYDIFIYRKLDLKHFIEVNIIEGYFEQKRI